MNPVGFKQRRTPFQMPPPIPRIIHRAYGHHFQYAEDYTAGEDVWVAGFEDGFKEGDGGLVEGEGVVGGGCGCGVCCVVCRGGRGLVGGFAFDVAGGDGEEGVEEGSGVVGEDRDVDCEVEGCVEHVELGKD